MKKWEDIVRDKMEEPEGALPESVFAEFRARRDAATVVPAPKRFPLVWAIVPAVAAGLAAVLLLRQPPVPEDGIQIIQQPSVPVAVLTDSTSVSEQEQTAPLIAQAVTPKAGRPSAIRPQEANDDATKEGVTTSLEDEPASTSVNAATEATPKEETAVKESEINPSSPFLSKETEVKTISMKVAPAAGVIAGGGLLAAVAAPLLGAGGSAAPVYQEDHSYNGGTVTVPDTPINERIGEAIHYFPLRLGLSASVPISERFSITTGVDYSWYKSSFTYALSGKKIQNAHYLGIPVRLDWTLASDKWWDIYLGGGLEGDWCVGASLGGNRISKDGFSASLQGAGGIQFKPTKHMGLYLEPQVNWRFTPENPALETYRTAHPLLFSVAAGLRFKIGK